MKGYKKSLESFIEYVFERYGDDEYISGFKGIYNDRQQKLVNKIPKRKADKVVISPETATICQKLVKVETERVKVFGGTKEYQKRLQVAEKELSGKFVDILGLLKRINDDGRHD